MKTAIVVNERNLRVPTPEVGHGPKNQDKLKVSGTTYDTQSGNPEPVKNRGKKGCFLSETSQSEGDPSSKPRTQRYRLESGQSFGSQAEVEQQTLIDELKSIPDPSDNLKERSSFFNYSY